MKEPKGCFVLQETHSPQSTSLWHFQAPCYSADQKLSPGQEVFYCSCSWWAPVPRSYKRVSIQTNYTQIKSLMCIISTLLLFTEVCQTEDIKERKWMTRKDKGISQLLWYSFIYQNRDIHSSSISKIFTSHCIILTCVLFFTLIIRIERGPVLNSSSSFFIYHKQRVRNSSTIKWNV